MENHDNKLNVLGGLLKRIGNLDMSTFEGRLLLQKKVYFLQTFSIYLEYFFSLYIRGPYCPELTKDGFELSKRFDKIKKIEFKNKDMENNFNRFLSFINEIKDNPFELEVLASIHLFRRLFPQKTRNEITKTLIKQKPYLTEEVCKNAFGRLNKFGLW